jgi:hypothetical protein
MEANGPANGKRDKKRELIRKHGDASISALRRAYGRYFAPGMPETEKLADVIHQLDERSIAKLGRESR